MKIKYIGGVWQRPTLTTKNDKACGDRFLFFIVNSLRRRLEDSVTKIFKYLTLVETADSAGCYNFKRKRRTMLGIVINKYIFRVK